MIRRRRARLLTDLPAWLVFAWAFGLLLYAHAFFCTPPQVLHPLDEGYVNAFAWRMNTGHMLPYVDAVSHRGPMMYWAAALAQRLGSPTSWMPLRVLSAVCGLCTITFAFLAARRAGRALAGAIAVTGLLVVYLVGMWPIDGMAYSGEHLSNAFMMAALFCLTAALDPDRARPSVALVAAAGALAALNALSKQPGAAVIGTLGLWVLMTAWGRPGLSRRDGVALVSAFVVGALLPVALVVARYAAAGEVRTLFYYAFTYNTEVYLGPYDHNQRVDRALGWLDTHGVLLGILGPLGVWAATRPLSLAPRLRDVPRAYDENGFVATIGLSSLLLALASNASLRDFVHYYLQAAPWPCLLLGVVVDGAMAARRATVREAVVRLLIALPMIVLLRVTVSRRLAKYERERVTKVGFVDTRASKICAFVHTRSRPGDTLFIWGFNPEYYTTCERRPASRYVFTTFVAGYVPWFDGATKADDDARTVPRGRELLLEDLEEARPPVILDMPQSMGNRSMKRYEPLAKYLLAHYCSAGKVDGAVEGLLRRDAQGRCPLGSQ